MTDQAGTTGGHGSARKSESLAAVCNEAKENLSLLNMATDLTNKTSVLGKHQKCLGWNERRGAL